MIFIYWKNRLIFQCFFRFGIFIEFCNSNIEHYNHSNMKSYLFLLILSLSSFVLSAKVDDNQMHSQWTLPTCDKQFKNVQKQVKVFNLNEKIYMQYDFVFDSPQDTSMIFSWYAHEIDNETLTWNDKALKIQKTEAEPIDSDFNRLIDQKYQVYVDVKKGIHVVCIKFIVMPSFQLQEDRFYLNIPSESKINFNFPNYIELKKNIKIGQFYQIEISKIDDFYSKLNSILLQLYVFIPIFLTIWGFFYLKPFVLSFIFLLFPFFYNQISLFLSKNLSPELIDIKYCLEYMLPFYIFSFHILVSFVIISFILLLKAFNKSIK